MSEEEKTPSLEDTAGDSAPEAATGATGDDTASGDPVGSGVAGSSTDSGADAPDATGSKAYNAEQFLQVFEVNRNADDNTYEMTVSSDLQEQLKSGAITREDFNKKIKEAQEFLVSGKEVKSGRYEPWQGLSDGKEIPTLLPFTKSDVRMVEVLYLQQAQNNIRRAFHVEKDGTGASFLKSNSDASFETIKKAAKDLKGLGWTSAETIDRGTNDDGSEWFVVTYTPSTAKEKHLLSIPHFISDEDEKADGLAGRIRGSLSNIGGLIRGGEGKEVGNIEGGDAVKGGDPTMHIDTGFGDGSSLFEGRSPVDVKQFSELGVGVGDTVSDVLISQIEKIFEKLNADVKLYYTWVLNALRNRATNAAETLRDFCLDKDDKHPGAISNITSQILKGDREGAEATLRDIRELNRSCDHINVDTNMIKRSLKEVDKILEKNKDILEKYKNGIPGYEGRGKEVADMLAPALKKLSVAVANKYEKKISRSNPMSSARAERGAYTP